MKQASIRNMKLHDLYKSRGIVRLLKSRSLRWVGWLNGRDEKCIQNFGGEIS
jgi:hypothetical protein